AGGLPSGISVSRVDSSGNVLSTFRFQAGTLPNPQAAATDALGNLWIVGSTGIPFRGLIAELDRTCTSLLYSGTFGGVDPQGSTEIKSIVFDNAGAAYLAGSTSQNDFPRTPGAFIGKFGSPPQTAGWIFEGPAQFGFVSKIAVNTPS